MQYFHNGPLNKNIYTHLFELVTKLSLHATSSIQFFSKQQSHNKCLFAEINGIKVNVSELIKRSNFKHIEMSESDSQAYMAYHKRLPYGEQRFSTPQYNKILPAEKHALTDYTGVAAYRVNAFLHDGKFDLNVDTIAEVQDFAVSLLSQTVAIASGLNKIPLTLSHQKAFRGECFIGEDEIQDRIDSFLHGDGLSKQTAFLSTSILSKMAKDFIGGPGGAFITFEGVHGKDIDNIGEAEFLLNQWTIQWLDHYVDNKGVHQFKARVVEPLDNANDEMTAEDIQALKVLVQLAEQNGISLDFMTTYMKNILDEEAKGSALKYDDIIMQDNFIEPISTSQDLPLVHHTALDDSSMMIEPETHIWG